ncbi:sensor histidine kinase [Desulfobulbus elongatus]|uniref:sensor histidine kinase n=1 Tax=Desulfobulbus elongatus TaxID=53332 RepID=UPI0006847F5C|nr:ATP-binding protein [Desulfobulbus elongatus]
MRGIFPRLLLSFSLTFLLAGLLSGLVVFSFSRLSVESFRNDFRKALHANLARSVVLMGQAAQMMRQLRGDRAFADYVADIESSMRTRLYLVLDNTVLPATSDPQILGLAARTGAATAPILEEDEGQLIVAQRLATPEGLTFTVIGLHQLGPPPGMTGPPPFPGKFGPGPPPFPPPEQEGLLALFGRTLGLRFLVFLPVAGLICLLLARSFSAPLDRLRRTSRQIAAGDLSARVGTSLGKPGNEIGDLGRDFDLMAERMEGLVNGQKRLLLDISHELRSPLARLNLTLELTKKRCADDDGNLARIGRESVRLNELIGQLLTLARSETAAIDADAPAVDLVALLQEIGADVDFETRGQGKGVRLLDCEAVTVTGSRELLRQAIENIVRNGAYYTRSGSPVEVRLSSRRDESGARMAVIRVRDYGPGVPEDKLPHLTEPFFRVAEARDRTSGGVGLGLAIAQQVVHQHGGLLRFANTLEREGLEVEIELPARDAAAAHGAHPADRPADGAGPRTSFS